jgi:hypothetical protein
LFFYGIIREEQKNKIKEVLMKNQMIVLSVWGIFLFFSILNGQITFERWYGSTSDDVGYSVVQTTDGGYIVAGYTNVSGGGGDQVYLIKTDSLGDTTWTKTHGGPYYDVANSIAQTTDGGYIVVGTTESFGAGYKDIYLIKTNPNGDTTWTKTFGGSDNDYGNSVAQTTDGGYIITGSKEGDVYLVKTDGTGNLLWEKTFGGVYSDYGLSVVQTSDVGYIIAGWTMPYGMGSSNVYLIKTDSIGDTLWTKTYGDSTNSIGNSVSQTMDGGYIITGYVVPFYFPDVYLIKTDAVGDTLWTKRFGSINGWDEGYSVVQTTDGGYSIAGFKELTYTNRDVYLIKTDAMGDSLWTKIFGGADFDEGYSIDQTSDSGYVIAGMTSSYGAGSQDVYLIKTDALGNTEIEEETNSRHLTKNIRLKAHPNPFRESVEIQVWNVSAYRCVGVSELQIYDISGRRVREISLLPFTFSLGVTWDGADDDGVMVTPGVYFLKLKVGTHTETTKLIKIE